MLKTLTEGGDDHDAQQRFRFAACLAMDGDERVKRLMYESYTPGPQMGDGIGINFLQMDGINGLLFAAEKMGALLMSTQEEVDLGWMVSVSSEDFGEQDTWNALRDAGKANPRIEAYRAAAEAARKGSDASSDKHRRLLNSSYDELKPNLPEMTSFGLASWGEHASEEDFMKAAHGFIAARDAKSQHDHLRIFGRRPFPLDIQLLLDLVDVKEENVGLAALLALSQTSHPRTRELAFHLVNKKAKWRGHAIDLLLRNFQPGDHATALGWFAAEQDDETRHSMGLDLRTLWEHHPDDGTEVRMLQALYEKGPCSFCREHAVHRMIEKNWLDEEKRAECVYDANDDICELVTTSVKGTSN